MLYQADAEENEGSGFAFANAQLGVSWMLVRGVSDSVWYPNAYDGVLASDHAATVLEYLAEHLPAKISKAPRRCPSSHRQPTPGRPVTSSATRTTSRSEQ